MTVFVFTGKVRYTNPSYHSDILLEPARNRFDYLQIPFFNLVFRSSRLARLGRKCNRPDDVIVTKETEVNRNRTILFLIQALTFRE